VCPDMCLSLTLSPCLSPSQGRILTHALGLPVLSVVALFLAALDLFRQFTGDSVCEPVGVYVNRMEFDTMKTVAANQCRCEGWRIDSGSA
jgi:hypothetical protein